MVQSGDSSQMFSRMLDGTTIKTHFPFKYEISNLRDKPDGTGNHIATISGENNGNNLDLEFRLEWYPPLPLSGELNYPKLDSFSVCLSADGHSIYQGRFEKFHISLYSAKICSVEPGEYEVKILDR